MSHLYFCNCLLTHLHVVLLLSYFLPDGEWCFPLENFGWFPGVFMVKEKLVGCIGALPHLLSTLCVSHTVGSDVPFLIVG